MVTGGRQQATTHVQVSRKKIQRVLGQRDTWREGVKPAVVVIRNSKLQERLQFMLHCLNHMLRQQSYKHQLVRGQSGPTFVDGGGPGTNKVAWYVYEKPTAEQAEIYLGSASGRFRVPIGATKPSIAMSRRASSEI